MATLQVPNIGHARASFAATGLNHIKSSTFDCAELNHIASQHRMFNAYTHRASAPPDQCVTDKVNHARRTSSASSKGLMRRARRAPSCVAGGGGDLASACGLDGPGPDAPIGDACASVATCGARRAVGAVGVASSDGPKANSCCRSAGRGWACAARISDCTVAQGQ